MRTTQDNRDETSGFARLTAAILLVLVVGMGYAVSAAGLPVAAEDQDGAEAAEVTECVSHGLVLSDCGVDL